MLNLLGELREGRSQEVHDVLPQEHLIRGIVSGGPEWCLDLSSFDHVEHVAEDEGLLLEPGLVLTVCQHNKDVLHQRNEVGLVKLVLKLGVVFGVVLDVDHQVVANLQPCLSNVAHCVLESPDNRVNDQLELGWRESKEGCK